MALRNAFHAAGFALTDLGRIPLVRAQQAVYFRNLQSDVMVTLTEITIIRAPLERCFDLARSLEAHRAGQAHRGETIVASAGLSCGLIGLGQRVTWKAKHFGVWQQLTSEITAMDRPVYFQDVMVRGVFRFLRHDHFFRALSSEETEMRDVFRFAAPLPILGRLAEIALLGRYMKAFLRERNAAIRRIAESEEWRSFLCAERLP